MAPDRLDQYRAKRSFDQTPEPAGDPVDKLLDDEDAPEGMRFVVQKHHARRLHYDFRIEADGVLISWAVPKGPSYDPKVKRLAVHVEDHPLDYRTFEGAIPGAQYGAGAVIVWDQGVYENITERKGSPVAVVDAVKAGHLSIRLDGTKLKGGWSLTRTSGREGEKESWILVKRSDDTARPGFEVTEEEPNSVKTGRSLEDVGRDGGGKQWTRARATWRRPMLAQLVKPDSHDREPAGRWRYERKLDGLRCLAVRNGDEVKLFSRNHLSYTERFPEIVAALHQLAADNFTIDGEIVAFEGSRTSFSALQRSGPDKQPVYQLFDVLHLLGQETTGLPLEDRQALLGQLLQGAPHVLGVVEALDGAPPDLLDQACREGWEGLVAKRVGSVYATGRSGDWQKLKCSASQELVIGGWSDPQRSRVGFGALLMGYYDDQGAFHYAGKVGTGFDQATLRDLHRQLLDRASDESPFAEVVREKGAHWVRPELVAEIRFSEWTTDGRLRHPSFKALRSDKEAASVRRERPAPG